jgi:hypothetical protein
VLYGGKNLFSLASYYRLAAYYPWVIRQITGCLTKTGYERRGKEPQKQEGLRNRADYQRESKVKRR